MLFLFRLEDLLQCIAHGQTHATSQAIMVRARRRRGQDKMKSTLRPAMSSLDIDDPDPHAAPEVSSAETATSGSRCWKILPLSADSEVSLQAASEQLGRHLAAHRDESLDDVAFTLQTGRASSPSRRAVVCRDSAAAIAALLPGGASSESVAWSCLGVADEAPPEVVFMFPGVGEQYVGMGYGLYEAEAVFRHHFDRCAAILRQVSDIDLHAELYPERASQPQQEREAAPADEIDPCASTGCAQKPTTADAPRMRRTALTQPALFATEYALAQLWMSWGIHPSAMIGHSLGEYAVACIAGVMSLEDAVRLVARRASLIEGLAAGAMLAVAMPEAQLRALLPAELSVAATNAPSRCVVAGSPEQVGAFKSALEARGVAHRDVNASHAFHSHMMEAIYPELIALFDGIRLQPPSIPYISNLTGDWITPEQATDPHDWARHTCQTVRFGDGVARFNGRGRYALVELGPGRSLASFVHQQTKITAPPRLQILRSLPAAQERLSGTQLMARSLSSLWCGGATVDWVAYHADEPTKRVRLPAPAAMSSVREEDHPGIETSRTASPRSGERNLETVTAPSPAGSYRPDARSTHIEPEGAVETMQAELWSAVLGVSEIGRDDDFFNLGGDSLAAVKLLNRVREALQLVLPLKVLFEHPTLREFATHVEHLLLEEIEALSEEEAQEQVLALDGRRDTLEQQRTHAGMEQSNFSSGELYDADGNP